MRTRTLATLGTLLAVTAAALPAQQAARPVAPFLGFSVGSLAIDGKAAESSFVGDRSWGIQLDGGAVINKYFQLGVDVGGQFLDDHATFTQNTTQGEMKSTASVTYFSALGGVRTPALGPMMLALNVGASATVSRRSIDNCVDCLVEKLKIPGGGFVEPTVFLGTRALKLRLTDRVYLGGNGMKSVISVGGQWEPRKKQK